MRKISTQYFARAALLLALVALPFAGCFNAEPSQADASNVIEYAFERVDPMYGTLTGSLTLRIGERTTAMGADGRDHEVYRIDYFVDDELEWNEYVDVRTGAIVAEFGPRQCQECPKPTYSMMMSGMPSLVAVVQKAPRLTHNFSLASQQDACSRWVPTAELRDFELRADRVGYRNPYSSVLGEVTVCDGDDVPRRLKTPTLTLSLISGAANIDFPSDDLAMTSPVRFARGPWRTPPNEGNVYAPTFRQAVAWATEHDTAFRDFLASHPSAQFVEGSTYFKGRAQGLSRVGLEIPRYETRFEYADSSGSYAIELEMSAREFEGSEIDRTYTITRSERGEGSDERIDPRAPIATIESSFAWAQSLAKNHTWYATSVRRDTASTTPEERVALDAYVYVFFFVPASASGGVAQLDTVWIDATTGRLLLVVV